MFVFLTMDAALRRKLWTSLPRYRLINCLGGKRMTILPVVAFRSSSVKFVPFLLAGGLLAAAALAPLAGRKDSGLDYARMFVECSDRLGPASCSGFLDRWEEDRPQARHEIKQRFARDQAFAMHLIALTDAQILTGAVPKAGSPPSFSHEQPFPGE